jgi:acyl carrier protein
MELFSEIKKMIVNIFAIEDEEVVSEAHLQDDLGGDSLAIMSLAEALGKSYGIEIQGEDLIEIDNVGELVEMVKSKISSML